MAAELILSSSEMAKAFATGRTPFQIRLGALGSQDRSFRVLPFVRDYLWRRSTHLKLGAHLLDLRGLLFHHCRETRNSAFQFRDPLLLFERLVKHGLAAVFMRALGNGFGLVLGSGLELALRNGYGHPVSIGIDEQRG